MRRGYSVLTGATGLLGRYLMRDLLLAGDRLAVLTRGTRTQSAHDRIEQILQFWEAQLGTELPRPVVLDGDITQPGLALNPHDGNWVRRYCDTMFHCAASLTFHELNGEPWRTNVDGTRNVLDFCAASGLAHLHYVSTAYVCGKREDLVREEELDVGQEFRNDYEKSKFLAEKMVREQPGLERTTIYRPVVITGDSVTGYTSTYHGTYLYMKLACVFSKNVEPDEHGKRHVPIRWGATGNELRNITPVDWNSEIICRLFHNPAAHGKTYQLAPTEPITMRDIIDYASRHYGITGIEFHGYATNPPFRLNELERWVWSNIKIYGQYDFMDPRFDMTNLHRFISDSPSPRLDYPMADRLMRYAEEDRWGKRKPSPVKPPQFDTARWLTAVVERSEPRHESGQGNGSNKGDGNRLVGLSVSGPGGGGYVLHLDADELVSWEKGLPRRSEADDFVTLDSKALAAMAQAGDHPLEIWKAFVTQLAKNTEVSSISS